MAENKETKEIRQRIADDKTQKASAKAYKDSIVYPETEDAVAKDTPTTAPLAKYATDNLFGKDVPAYKRAAGAAVLVPAAAANIAERGIRALGRKMSGDEEGKKKGGSIKAYAKGGSIRGGGCETKGKTKGRFV